jgi:hypothetical protein
VGGGVALLILLALVLLVLKRKPNSVDHAQHPAIAMNSMVRQA